MKYSICSICGWKWSVSIENHTEPYICPKCDKLPKVKTQLPKIKSEKYDFDEVKK